MSGTRPTRRLADIRRRATPPPVPTDDQPLFAELDELRSHGQGSWCTLWSFYLLFGTLLLLGSAALLWLRRGY